MSSHEWREPIKSTSGDHAALLCLVHPHGMPRDTMSPVCVLEVRLLAIIIRSLLSSKYYLSFVEGQREKCSSCILLRSVQLHQHKILRATFSVAQSDNVAHLYEGRSISNKHFQG